LSIPAEEAAMGTTIIVILLVPLIFQVFLSRQEQKKRHKEIEERLSRLEKLLSAKS
jgi:preprotein translocase subunit YajC